MFSRLALHHTRGTSLGGVPREQKLFKGHLPRVIYHRVYSDIECNFDDWDVKLLDEGLILLRMIMLLENFIAQRF